MVKRNDCKSCITWWNVLSIVGITWIIYSILTIPSKTPNLDTILIIYVMLGGLFTIIITFFALLKSIGEVE